MYSISKAFTFSASHQLTGLPDDHPCSRLHGHNYTVEIKLAAEILDDPGFVLDYGELTGFSDIVSGLDHQHLNDVFAFNPTAENLAKRLYDEAATVYGDLVTAVAVRETPKTWAEYRP